jgi:hypothetical protein
MENSKELEPLPNDGVKAVQVGTLIWTIAFIISLFASTTLARHGLKYSTYICLAGIILGLLGMRYTKRRAKRIREA